MKTILIAGASGQIGGAITKLLSQNGYKIIPTYHSYLNRIPDGDNVELPLRYKAGDTSTIELYFAQNDIKLGGFIDCAGINIPGNFLETETWIFEEVLRVNLLAPFGLTKAVWEYLEPGASLIYTGSVSSDLAGPTSGHYAASKSGLVTMARNIALFGAKRKIRANVVSPGYIISDMAQKGMKSNSVAKAVSDIPLKRLATLDEIAHAYLWLMRATYTTGQEIKVNGGLRW